MSITDFYNLISIWLLYAVVNDSMYALKLFNEYLIKIIIYSYVDSYLIVLLIHTILIIINYVLYLKLNPGYIFKSGCFKILTF